jgi:hypothetical protein
MNKAQKQAKMSAAIGKWTIQGEHSTKAAAEADRKNWM